MSRVVLRVEQAGRIVTPRGWCDGYRVVRVVDGQPVTDSVLRPHTAAWDEAARLMRELEAAGDEVTLG